MTEFLVKIDRSTIKYSDGIYQYICGPAVRKRTLEQIWDHLKEEWVTTAWSETVNQPTGTIHDLPGTYFNYEPTPVRCQYCGWQCLHTDLEEEYEEYSDCSYIERYKICPRCRESECCQLKFEKLSDIKE